MKTTPKLPCLARVSIFASGLFLAAQLHAATVTLNPTADAFVSASNPGNNYGSAGALEISAAGLPQGQFQTVMQFNLASAFSTFNTDYGVGNWNLQSISLSFTATAPNNPIFNNNAAGQFGVSWMQNDSWTEGTGTPMTPTTSGITYSTLSSFTGPNDENLGTFNFVGGTNGVGTYSLTLTPNFSADAAAGNVVSFRLFAADSVVSYLYDSRNFGTVSARPVLTIIAVPEPATLSVAGLGLALLLVGKRAARKLV